MNTLVLTILSLTLGLTATTHLHANQRPVPTGNPLLEQLPPDQRQSAEQLLSDSLQNLITTQLKDGGFPGPRPNQTANAPATTALAGIALISNGACSTNSPFHLPLVKALDFVLSSASNKGILGTNRDRPRSTTYVHFICTTFLAQAHNRMDPERNQQIATTLKPALAVILAAQNAPKRKGHEGGWRYTLTSNDSDLSCTGWAFRALVEARDAGFEIPQDALDRARDYTLTCYDRDGRFSYVAGTPAGTPSITRTAIGLYILEKSGLGQTEQATASASELLTRAKAGTNKQFGLYEIAWGTSAMSLRNDAAASDWSSWLYPTIAKLKSENSRKHLAPHLTPELSIASALSP